MQFAQMFVYSWFCCGLFVKTLSVLGYIKQVFATDSKCLKIKYLFKYIYFFYRKYLFDFIFVLFDNPSFLSPNYCLTKVILF
jgi:hypothetical protein